MALTRDFKVTIQERVLTDPEFRVGLLTQAAECLLDNEIDVAKASATRLRQRNPGI